MNKIRMLSIRILLDSSLLECVIVTWGILENFVLSQIRSMEMMMKR